MNTLAYKLSLAIIFATYGLLFYLAFLMFYPVRSFSSLKQPVPLSSHHYRAGQIVQMLPYTCRYNANRGEVERVIRSVEDPSIAFGVAETPLISRPNACDTYTVSILLPPNMPVGHYYIENTIRIRTNVMRVEEYLTNSEVFTIQP